MLSVVTTHKHEKTNYTAEHTPSAVEVFLNALCQQSILTSNDVTHVLKVSHETGEAFDLVLCKLGLLTETDLLQHFSKHAGLPNLSEHFDKKLYNGPILSLAGLNPIWIEQNRVLPLFDKADHIIAATVNPLNDSCAYGLSFAFKKPVSLMLVTQSQWEHLFAKLEQQSLCENENNEHTLNQNITADVERLKDMASAEPVVRLVNRLLSEASAARASDIHIEPGIREAFVRYRIDGELCDHETLSTSQSITATSRIKILSSLDIAERRRPQDGRFSFPVAGRSIDLRVSTVPTDHGESLVIRLLDQSRVQLDFKKLGFFPDTLETINHCLNQPHGILLVTGPTGSGKTTTLYTFLKELSTSDRKILTIEDPIEYRLDGINQSQVNTTIGVTFASALRSFLRHDPDVMMVGEIRDLETATIAVQAALTGHLVLSTLHTNDAPSAITRLRDIGIEDYLISSTLIGVIGQRLVRRKCKMCSVPTNNQTHTCTHCNATGFMGRLALVEALSINNKVQAAIREGEEISKLVRDHSSEFRSMADDGQRKVEAGLTIQREVEKAVGRSGNVCHD